MSSLYLHIEGHKHANKKASRKLGSRKWGSRPWLLLSLRFKVLCHLSSSPTSHIPVTLSSSAYMSPVTVTMGTLHMPRFSRSCADTVSEGFCRAAVSGLEWPWGTLVGKDQDAGTTSACVANSYPPCWEAGIHSGPVGAVGTAEQGPSPGDPGWIPSQGHASVSMWEGRTRLGASSSDRNCMEKFYLRNITDFIHHLQVESAGEAFRVLFSGSI